MNLLNACIDCCLRLLGGLLFPVRPVIATGVDAARPPVDRVRWRGGYFNTGGPRSRVVKSSLTSRLLSEGSKVLGTHPLGAFQVRPGRNFGSLRKLLAGALESFGFSSPEEAWNEWREELPDRRAIIVEKKLYPEGSARQEPRELLRHALVLGRCCGKLFSPERPLIWSERRLGRGVVLVELDCETFTGEDDDE